MGDMLGTYFSVREFERNRRNLPNVMPASARRNAVALVAIILDPLRRRIGRPIRVNSGYRCDAVNQAVGGSPTSSHPYGEAADIDVVGMSAEALATEIIRLNVPFDQVIWYADIVGGHVHVSYSPRRGNRGATLYVPRAGVYQRWTPPLTPDEARFTDG